MRFQPLDPRQMGYPPMRVRNICPADVKAIQTARHEQVRMSSESNARRKTAIARVRWQ